MIAFDIPDYGDLEISHLVLDYNGTLACDGELLPGVLGLLKQLSENVSIHILTADTFGNVREGVKDIPCELHILPKVNQSQAKLDYVSELGIIDTICIGNGRNDRLMLDEATVGIAVIQKEGASFQSLQAADVICTSIIDALELLVYPKRMTATLRS
jgi:soluble P-type ATPase